MKKAAASAVCGLALSALAIAAHAGPMPGSSADNPVVASYAFDTASPTGGYSASVKGVKGTYFQDLWTFTLGGTSDLTGGLSSIASSLKNPAYDLDIQHFDLLQWNTASNAFALYQAGQQMTSGFTDFWTLSASGLGGGKFAVSIAGKINGKTGGSYGGNINITQLPEPQTWALLLGGIAAMVFLPRRRKDTSPDVAAAC